MRNELLLGRIYEAALHPDGWATVAHDLEEVLGGAVLLALPQPRPGRRGRIVAPSLKPRFVESYATRFYSLDPRRSESATQPVESLLRTPDSDAEATTPFFRDWMEPQGLHHPCRGLIERDPHFGLATVDVYRRHGEAPLSDTARRTLESLLPHLRRAAQLFAQQLRLDEERRGLSAISDQFPVGVVLVDGCGRLRSANRVGEALLSRRDGLCAAKDGLHAASADVTCELRESIAQAADPSGDDDFVSAVLLPRPSGRKPLQVLVAPARSRQGARHGALAVLYVCDPEACAEPSNEILRTLYKLTPAEAALVSHLTVGRTLEEAAGSLGITRGTARQRLGQIFSKTGTCRQAALVRMVLTGPAAMQSNDAAESLAAS